MDRPPALPRRHLATAAAVVAALAIAVPVLAQPRPGPAAEPPEPAASPAATENPGRGPKADKVRTPTTPVTLTGVVGTRDETDGRPEYTLTVGATVYLLHVGPPWWWDDANPLAAKVGKTVTVEGDRHEGSNDVDVRTVDGTVVREPGRPPWAGGPNAVGERHPGWKAWKAERWELKQAWKAGRVPGPPPWAGPKASPTATP